MEGGMHWGIYDSWTHSEYDDKVGTTLCSSEYTGHRWDPWHACSVASGDQYCEQNDGCVPPSNWKGSLADEYEYICNPFSYEYNPFVCEMGDLSGKYGLIYVDEDDDYEVLVDHSSYFEVDSYDLGGKSIVFRCHDTRRAFCAPFEEHEPTVQQEETFIRPYQNWTQAYSQKATLGESSYVLLTYYGRYEIVIDTSDPEWSVPGDCGNKIYYRIFSSWDETDPFCDDREFYDPSLTCVYNTDADNLGWCEDGELCGKSSWDYDCAYYDEDVYNRLNCAPGDLSGKWGDIDISDNINFRFNISGYDPKMMPMSHIVGKSMVLQCSSDWAIIACAPFADYTDDAGLAAGGGLDSEDSSDSSGGGNKNKNNGTFLGVSNTVVLIMLILALASIVPCVRSCRNKKAGAATGVGDEMYSQDPRTFGDSQLDNRGIVGKIRSMKFGKESRLQSQSNIRQESQSGGGYYEGNHSRQESQSTGYGGRGLKTNQQRTMPSLQTGAI